jgi:hypothetical protein
MGAPASYVGLACETVSGSVAARAEAEAATDETATAEAEAPGEMRAALELELAPPGFFAQPSATASVRPR